MTPEQAQALIEAINRLADVAHFIFDLDVSLQTAAVWGAGFMLPMSLYVIASVVGSIANFWRSH